MPAFGIDNTKAAGSCGCPEANCYHTDPARAEERRSNAAKGPQMREYYKKTSETGRDKALLRKLAALAADGEISPATLTAITRTYDTVKDYIRVEGELHRQHVLLPQLMDEDNG